MLQALVVLVHDMGPNWELVNDAINSTIQFKVMICRYNYTYRKGAIVAGQKDIFNDSCHN